MLLPAVSTSEYKFVLAIAPFMVSPDNQPFRFCMYGHKRKNWDFCWTELGTEKAVQGLTATCRVRGIEVYTCPVDVLNRASRRPATRVAGLTPRQSEQHFVANTLHSVLRAIGP
jgi:hypothetical protein